MLIIPKNVLKTIFANGIISKPIVNIIIAVIAYNVATIIVTFPNKRFSHYHKNAIKQVKWRSGTIVG